TVDQYEQNVKQIEMFLKGQTEELKEQIQEKMDDAAHLQNYEIAAFWRDKLQAIDNSVITQNVLLDKKENKDILSYYNDEKRKFIAMVIIHIREGKIAKKTSYSFNIKDKLIHKNDIFPSIMEQFYQDVAQNLPD
ncbi:unnamed protein product, partial [marine sediment metagenome]